MRKNHRLLLQVKVICAISVFATLGCSKPSNQARTKEEPAHVAHRVEESDLNTIKLTKKAVGRLGIRLATVQLSNVQRRRAFGGEVVVPPGKTIVVSAPLAGTLLPPDSGSVPLPGNKLESGQKVFNFKPLLTPERDVLTPAERVRVAQTKADVAMAQIEAKRQIKSAKIAVDAARIAYDRAVELLRNKAGSQRSVDEADAVLKLAIEAETTAKTRYEFLSGIELDEHVGEQTLLAITSPVAGILQNLEAVAGETISVGQSLFSVMKTDQVWVRVPVYVGQWRQIDTGKPASVTEFGQRLDAKARPASYTTAPPSANANAATVDLYYALPNPDGQLYPGQKLSVTLPLKGRAENLIVPFSAILYDIHGGAWVYQQLDGHVYERRRVSVEHVVGNNAILAAGPEIGAKVVTDGAAELFGTEFGVGH